MLSMKALRQKSFLDNFSSQTIIEVRPDEINDISGVEYHTTREIRDNLKRVLPQAIYAGVVKIFLNNIENYIIPKDKFHYGRGIKDTKRYQKIADFIENINYLDKTTWFEILMHALEKNGVAKHKKITMHSRQDILSFLMQYRKIVESIDSKGFCERYTGFESSGIIDADGNIIKNLHGNHRFCIAKVLKLEEFPLKIIGVHEDWVRKFRKENTPLQEVILDALDATREKYSTGNSSNMAQANERTPPHDSIGDTRAS